MFNNRLNELGLTRTDFIRKFHDDYGEIGSRNHLYKVLNGQTIVGERGMLPQICKSMGLNVEEVLKMVRTDKIQDKDWANALPKANKVVQELATIMESLNKRDQEEILKFAKMKGNLL